MLVLCLDDAGGCVGDTGGGLGGRVGAADASLVFPQTLVIHSVSASFSWSLLRYNMGDDTQHADKHTKKLLRFYTLGFFSISVTIEMSCPH